MIGDILAICAGGLAAVFFLWVAFRVIEKECLIQ
jgi:hypothetical protein